MTPLCVIWGQGRLPHSLILERLQGIIGEAIARFAAKLTAKLHELRFMYRPPGEKS